MRTQKANPGGNLAPNEIVGRDQFVRRLWRILERSSLYITAERRMGKTSVVRDKMGKETPQGWRLIYLDVSKAVTPQQFIEALLHTCHAHLDTKTKNKFAFDSVVSKLSGVSFKAGVEVKLPENLGASWKKLLETLLHDLAALEPRVVLAFDELPLMLDAIRRHAGESASEALVMDLLDTLRAVRQEKDLRMIYTGSLGLHHVLTLLREQGYQNDPTNDMASLDLEPLTQEDATELACRLLRGEDVFCNDVNDVAAHLASVTDGIPFYIQHLVQGIGWEEAEGTREEVDRRLATCLRDPLDPWHLNYYDERIDTHYPKAYAVMARLLLDQLAARPLQTLEELTDGIDPAKSERDPETVLKVLRLLGMDHYVLPEDDAYRFRSSFIRRVWQSRRGKRA